MSKNNMVVRAIFTGEHGSMGYSRGSRYRLFIEKNMIHPKNDTKAKPCPYTVEGFLANWTVEEVTEQ